MAMILDKRVTNSALDIPYEKPGMDSSADQHTETIEQDSPETIRVNTTRFGTLEVEQDLTIHFAEGIIGFEHCQKFIVVRHDENSSFRWLQSLDCPSVAFPIVEPNEFRPDYAPTISNSDASSLGLEPSTPNLLFAIVTVPPSSPRNMTANLLGPLVINGLTRQGKQVIVQDDCYNTRHEIMAELERTNSLAVAPVNASRSSRESAPAQKSRPIENKRQKSRAA